MKYSALLCLLFCFSACSESTGQTSVDASVDGKIDSAVMVDATEPDASSTDTSLSNLPTCRYEDRDEQKHLILRGQNSDANASFVLALCNTESGVGESLIFRADYFSLTWNGTEHIASAEQIEYMNSHHNWRDSLEVRDAQRRLAWNYSSKIPMNSGFAISSKQKSATCHCRKPRCRRLAKTAHTSHSRRQNSEEPDQSTIRRVATLDRMWRRFFCRTT